MFLRDLLYFYGRLLGTEVGPISNLPGCILKNILSTDRRCRRQRGMPDENYINIQAIDQRQRLKKA